MAPSRSPEVLPDPNTHCYRDAITTSQISNRVTSTSPRSEIRNSGITTSASSECCMNALLRSQPHACIASTMRLAFCATIPRGPAPGATGMTFGASSLATVMQMVAGGYGVTLIPQIAADVEARDSRVKFLRLEEPQPGRSIGLAFRRTSPRKADFEALGDVVKGCTKA